MPFRLICLRIDHARKLTPEARRMELKPTDLILRRREAPSRRMAAGSVSLVAVLRDARKSALLRTRLIDASI
jgi:hypothetical protein